MPRISKSLANKHAIVACYIRLVLTIIVWGGVYHVAKYLVLASDPLTISAIRFSLASILLIAMYLAHCKRHGNLAVSHLNSAQWRTLIAGGVVGVFIYSLLFFAAESLIAANHVVLIYSFTPCMTVFLCARLLHIKLNKFALVGVLVALCGTIIVIILSSLGYNDDHIITYGNHYSKLHALLGTLCAIFAAFGMAIYSIINKHAANLGITGLTMVTFSAVIGASLLDVLYIFYGTPLKAVLSSSNWLFWAEMGYIVVFGTVYSYKWYSEAIATIGISQVAVFLNGVPLATIAISVFLLKQTVSPLIFIAGLVIIAGVIVTNYAMNKGSN